MASITLDGVSKVFPDGTKAVWDMHLHVDDGEFVILVGPSGCGKTTALRMVAGLEEISEGELRIGDQIVNDLTPKERNIAMVFQSYAPYPHMTVEENLEMGAYIRDDDFRATIDQVYGLFPAIAAKRRQNAGELSGGQRQQVAVGRALMTRPKLLMLDEPTAGVSPIVMDELFDRIIEQAVTSPPFPNPPPHAGEGRVGAGADAAWRPPAPQAGG